MVAGCLGCLGLIAMKAGHLPDGNIRRAQDGWIPEFPPLSRGTSNTSPLVANVVSESSVLATVAGQGTYPQCVVEAATPVLDACPSKRNGHQARWGTGFLHDTALQSWSNAVAQ